jgi:hypothetical protein
MAKIEHDLDAQLREVDRELRQRKFFYPTQIKIGKLTTLQANDRYSKLKAVKRSLERLKAIESQQLELFKQK